MDSACPSDPGIVPDSSAERGLFIIGAARSGTTVLQNALNDSTQIFLFGEPDFHGDPGTPDFAARYNHLHRGLANQENKSTFCPPLFEGDAPWHQYLVRLSALYGYVGSKVVLYPRADAGQANRLFAFHSRFFHRSHYLFTFRNPLDVVVSSQRLAEYLQWELAADQASLLYNYLQVMDLYMRMLRNLPYVRALFHENIDATAIAGLGQWLQLDLSRSAAYYDEARVHRHSLDAIAPDLRERFAVVSEIYEQFRESCLRGFELVQLGQNENHLDPAHFTELGDLARRVRWNMAALAPAA